MKRAYLVIGAVVLVALNVAMTFKKSNDQIAYNEKLSDYGFFEGEIKIQKPAPTVMPYALNSPLFSDYAKKLRFVKLPNGTTVDYNADSVFQFPVGTSIIKTFYYPIMQVIG